MSEGLAAEAELRAMVDRYCVELKEASAIESAAVERALRTVQRHRLPAGGWQIERRFYRERLTLAERTHHDPFGINKEPGPGPVRGTFRGTAHGPTYYGPYDRPGRDEPPRDPHR